MGRSCYVFVLQLLWDLRYSLVSMVACHELPWSTEDLGRLIVVYLCCYVIVLYVFTYVYLYCLASILRSSSAYHLDTAAGLLSVAYGPFGTVSSSVLSLLQGY